MSKEKNSNVSVGMACCHFWSVETPTLEGMHQPLSDVSSANLPYGRGDDSVCPGLLPKGYHNRSNAVFRTPRSPAEFLKHDFAGGLVTNKTRELTV